MFENHSFARANVVKRNNPVIYPILFLDHCQLKSISHVRGLSHEQLCDLRVTSNKITDGARHVINSNCVYIELRVIVL